MAPGCPEPAHCQPDWNVHLRARGRTRGTRDSYMVVARTFVAYLQSKGMPTSASGVTREHIEHYLADLHDRVSPATVAKHYRSLQQLWRWLAQDGEIPRSPMERMHPPTVPEQPIPVLDVETISKLLATCKGNTFEQRRDTAIIRLFLDTGMRVSELVGMTLDDIDQAQSVVFVVGKGRRGGACPHGVKTADALRRYLRARTRHPMSATTNKAWIGSKGPMTDSGVRQVLVRRSKDAGLEPIHPHQFRHFFAHQWLSAGGQETDLMRLAGWKSRQMVSRYAASAADERARDAHRRMALRDQL
jgi:site-specific recombinase XerD